jgi:hypothetical protein
VLFERACVATTAFAALVLFVLVQAAAWAGPAFAQGKAGGQGVFQALKVGQFVQLRPAGHGWDVTLLDDGKVGSHQVLAVGANHLHLHEISGITQVWVPLTAIHSVSWAQTSNATGKPLQLPNLPPHLAPKKP